MQVIRHLSQRVSNVLSEIEKLKGSDFPHDDSKEALDRIDLALRERLGELESRGEESDTTVVEALCSAINREINLYIKLLGIILRSTNVRNAFEYHEPLKRILLKLIGKNGKFILSSEWHYVPFTYPLSVRKLPNFAIVGLPASESGNSLIVPAAGHEIGHSVWANHDLKSAFGDEIENRIVDFVQSKRAEIKAADPTLDTPDVRSDLIWRNRLSVPIQYTTKQCEELFCDFLGLRIFGQSYLFSISYLLAPYLSKTRSPRYPELVDRATYLAMAAEKFSVEVPEGFVDSFSRQDSPYKSGVDRIIGVAMDEATRELVPSLIDQARKECDDASIPMPSPAASAQIFEGFTKLIPASKVTCIADIVNAAWAANNSSQLWSDNPELTDRKLAAINELVFKSIEILEYETRVMD